MLGESSLHPQIIRLICAVMGATKVLPKGHQDLCQERPEVPFHSPLRSDLQVQAKHSVQHQNPTGSRHAQHNIMTLHFDAQAIKHSNFFMNSMRVGTLPTDNGVNYRANSLTYESGPGMSDLTGGWLTGGGAGNLKMTMPTAFATSMLAWGLLSFPQGLQRERPDCFHTGECQVGACHQS